MSRANTERAYVRNVISKYGGMIQIGTAVQIPPQTWEKNVPSGRINGMPYLPAERRIISAGIPGYAGHLPYESVPSSAYTGLRGADSNHGTRHDRFAIDRTLQPKRMPIVGYSGHIRNTKSSTDCYGTSRWRSRVPVTRSTQLAYAREQAQKRALLGSADMKPREQLRSGVEDTLLQC